MALNTIFSVGRRSWHLKPHNPWFYHAECGAKFVYAHANNLALDEGSNYGEIIKQWRVHGQGTG